MCQIDLLPKIACINNNNAECNIGMHKLRSPCSPITVSTVTHRCLSSFFSLVFQFNYFFFLFYFQDDTLFIFIFLFVLHSDNSNYSHTNTRILIIIPLLLFIETRYVYKLNSMKITDTVIVALLLWNDG